MGVTADGERGHMSAAPRSPGAESNRRVGDGSPIVDDRGELFGGTDE
jgi:hypothetical protein